MSSLAQSIGHNYCGQHSAEASISLPVNVRPRRRREVVVSDESAQKEYRKPPIEEAIVQFQFAPDESWDASLAGKLHQDSRIKPHYPATPRTQEFIQLNIQVNPPEHKSALSKTAEHIQLLSEDSRRIITVGDHVVGISALRPYERWSDLRERCASVLAALVDVTERSTLPALARVGVRYVNRLMIPLGTRDPQQLELESFFNCGPRDVEGLPPAMDHFVCRTSGAYEDGARLICTFASLPQFREDGRLAFLLDIDIAQQFDGVQFEADEVLALTDRAHERIKEVFEASITSKTRRVLNEN